MTFPISYFLFFCTLLTGTSLSICSSSWFGAWIGLELNLLSFIPLIAIKLCPYSTEAAIKYFLIQAMASTILIMSSSMHMFSNDFSYILITLSLLLKLGAAPLHFWFPQVIEGLTWPQAFILLTIQKLAPMFLISYLTYSSNLIFMITLAAILSSLIGALGGLNIMKLRKLMAFSSINHMSWMLIAMTINDMMWLTYFLFYSFISGSVIILLHSTQTYSISNLMNQNKNSSILNLLLPLNLLSLGGLPPFMGFSPKWIMIQLLSSKMMIFSLLVILFSSLITLYFYLRIFIPMILLSFPSFSSLLKIKSLWAFSPFLAIFTFINMFGLCLPIPFSI
ncbi:NADH dehydrogenase subunit 2 (mitochondrion) [Scylla paramamosain]|uniref:NADH-ubiquinone oxidoreductase chain 2 n=1 Tax=Scylla paramamosain TaxID=85552 RepID=C1KH03_SCYPA|nr:NADH dehydrogenase subunit 2 [Scylla paramamosain]ACO07229.1 NADH dehydrogenase subunit 2 [Scylla paramamosain]AVF96912.1 NADH dehydrogenase subunit 2 [Scylla paramamosain]